MRARHLLPVLVAALVHAAPAVARNLPACSATIGEPAVQPGVRVEDAPQAADDLASLLVTVEATGAHMRVYYDAASEGAARSRAACLGEQLALLTRELRDDRSAPEWFSVVFTQDQAYVPPRGPDDKPRWAVLVPADGKLDGRAQNLLLNVIPHEQVHDYQQRAQAGLPRWFGEGHAVWTASRITPALDSAAARAELARLSAAKAASTGPLKLAEWGSVRPRREAFMRQVSAEDRARMEADPEFIPAGTFRFTRADMIGDESNMEARYAGALEVFEALARRHGAQAVQAWAAELTGASGRVTPSALSDSVRRHFGESLDELLRDR